MLLAKITVRGGFQQHLFIISLGRGQLGLDCTTRPVRRACTSSREPNEQVYERLLQLKTNQKHILACYDKHRLLNELSLTDDFLEILRAPAVMNVSTAFFI